MNIILELEYYIKFSTKKAIPIHLLMNWRLSDIKVIDIYKCEKVCAWVWACVRVGRWAGGRAGEQPACQPACLPVCMHVCACVHQVK